MEKVNALKIRNKIGKILDRLNATGEPIPISKGLKIRAVLVTLEPFEKRFLDWQPKQDKQRLFETVHSLEREKDGMDNSTEILRRLRGYQN